MYDAARCAAVVLAGGGDLAVAGHSRYAWPMRGRYLLHAPPDLIARAFGIEFSETGRDLGGALGPRFNIAPSQQVPIVRNKPAGGELTILRLTAGGAERELVTACWGLIPGWAEDPAIGHKLVNARAERLAEKPAFRAAFNARRCVVPASGFYE